MALLHEKDTETTTLLQVIQEAEASAADQFELIHLSLDSGRDLILVAITGDNLDSLGRILEGLRDLREV
jgi:hypothetical protein